jgi:tRNA threonylcarbamoyladenosine biosynthesis protein TsaB
VVNIVAIESATETVGVAVRSESGIQAVFTAEGRRRHVETLAPALEHLLVQVGLAVTDVDVVAVDLGPGLFTGLRVGVAAAKGLAQALGIGIVGISSLDILTGAAMQLGLRGHILAAVDARRGEVFATVTDIDSHGQEILAPGLFAPEELAMALRELEGVPVRGVGDGVQRYAEVLELVPGVSCMTGALGAPPPLTLLNLATTQLEAGVAPMEPRLIVPVYMRDADAKSNFAQAKAI